MPEYIDELIGCHCEEDARCANVIFKHDDNGNGILINTIVCSGCNKAVKIKSVIQTVYDVTEVLSIRSTPLTANNPTESK